jgi:hypothetical protein
VDAGGEIVHPVTELVVTGELGSFVGEVGSLVLQLFSTCSDLSGAALRFGDFNESILVEVNEAAPLGVGSVDLAVQPGQFGGEEFVVGIGICRVTACSPAGSGSGWVMAARMWSNTKASSASARMWRSGQRRDSPLARMGSWLRQR